MSDDDIAIVGVGCRFPGADDIDQFWRVLVNGENHVKEIPLERWNHEAFYSEDPNEPGKIYTKRAGLLNRHDEFDNRVFGISEAEAERMDPQQKHVLECVHMAMEDGGFTRTQLHGSSTGVYIGSMNDDHKIQSSSGDHNGDSSYSATGMSTSVLAARVSYVYNLLGPCLSLDTACSSALIAIHLGSQAITSGDCELAICGGVSSILSPDTFMALCTARMMSPTGQCQAFTDAADGYARGEGCGIVILKKLKQALQDKNNIWAVIKTGTNQDGRMANPMTAPSGEQQVELLKKVFSRHQVDPSLVQYIEAHGTGTSIGDPTEVNSLGTFFSQYHRGENEPDILLGSVKTNIGHTESAAGVAGLIKVLLMMKNGQIVPSLHVKKDKSNLNPKIDLKKYGFDIALDVSKWNSNEEGDRISCVNSFGFGGSNSHAIIIQKANFVHSVNRPNETQDQSDHNDRNASKDYHLVCLSAADKVGLQNTIDGFVSELENSYFETSDIAYTSSCHRHHFMYRLGVVAKDNSELIEQFIKSKEQIEQLKPVKKRKVIFVFCGVGTSWTGMCKELVSTEPVFRETVERIDKHLKRYVNWSITEKFQNNTDYSEPLLNHIAIFCAQVALSELWKSWDITPDMIIGQSVGEVAAAYVSGCLTLEDAVKVIYYRSKCLANQTGGGMMVIGNYDTDKVMEICEKYENQVEIAVYSSPTACTVSGDKIIIQKIKGDLEKLSGNKQQNIMLKELSVQCAYHSSHVDSCCKSLKMDLGTLTGQNKKTPHISTVTGKEAFEETFQSADYWADNVRKPVLFMQSIQSASEPDKMNLFIEIGPKPVLRAHLPTFLDHKTNISLPSMGYQKECRTMYESVSALYQIGCSIDWDRFVKVRGFIVPLPKYKFNKSKMLFTSDRQKRYLKGIATEEGTGQHMFLQSSVNENASFRIMIDKKTTPYVYDHFLHNTVLVPGATYVEAAFEIGQRCSSSTAFGVGVSVEFINPLTPSGDKVYEVEVDTSSLQSDGPISFTATKDKRLFAEGKIFQRFERARISVDIDEIKQICIQELTKADSYRCLSEFGFRYGDSLSLIQRSWSSGTECLAEIEVPETIFSQFKATHMHPAIIDAVFQTFGILSIKGERDVDDEVEVGPTLPKGVGSFVLNSAPLKHMFVYAKETKKTKSGNHYNALLLATNGAVIAEVNDFYTRTVVLPSNEKDQDLVYELTWKKQNLKQTNSGVSSTGTVVILGKQRFINRIKECNTQLKLRLLELREDLSDTVLAFNSFSDADKKAVSSVILAFTSSLKNNKDNGQAILLEAKQAFLAVKELIIAMNDCSMTVPLTVVTECTQKVPGRDTNMLKVQGSELWGLVRSAIREVAYSSLRIIDMDLAVSSMNTFHNVVADNSLTGTEYTIDNGNLFYSKLISYPREKLDKNQIDLTYDSNELTFLMSSSQRVLESPHFRLAQLAEETIIDQEESLVKILPISVCLHDKNIYPVTSGQSEGVHSLWPETHSAGFQMLAIEGKGYLKILAENGKKNQRFLQSPKVIFCSPCKVASTISVYKECILKEDWLPAYKPGMITSSVILWSLIESEVDVASVVVVVCDCSTVYLARMAAALIGMHTGCFGVVLLKDNLFNDIAEKIGQMQYVKSAVLLTTLNIDQIQLLLSQMKTIKRFVTLRYLMPRDNYRQIVNLFMHDVSIRILETESILLPSAMKKKVPKVVKWLRSLDNDFWSNTEVAAQRKGGLYPRKMNNILMFPYDTFSISDFPDQNCKNNLEKSQSQFIQNVPLRVTKSNLFRQNGGYVIVGGLTGLGWELLNLMAEMGAGTLVTLSRRTPNDVQKKEIQDVMFKFDCNIITLQTDITNFQKLQETFNEIESKLGCIPIRGVLQGGGVLSDTLLTKMSKEQMEAPMLPKILGTWNLHLVTKDKKMDFFIMHSSIVSIFGNKGQCNYGSGNAFMDCLAHCRRGLGLPGQSINWGALAVGMAVQDKNTEKSLNLQGMMLLNRYDIRTCFLYALMTNEPQITFGNFDWGKMASFGPYPSNLTSLIEYGMHINKPSSIKSGKSRIDLNEFKLLNEEEKHQKMLELVLDVVCDVFVAEKDSLDTETTFVSLGIDSMAGMTFVNVAFDRTQVRIPIVNLLSDQSTIGTMTQYLLDNLKYESEDEAKAGNLPVQKLLYGKIPFMQQSLLQEYVQDPDNPCWVRMADLEIQGIRVSIRSWKAILTHVLKINPELRRLYILDSENYEFDSYIVPVEDAKVELERVSFESVKKEVSEADIRKGHTFDLRTQFPVRFKVATEGDCSILRVMLHAVVNDITTWAMIFQDLAIVIEKYAKRKRLPEDKPFVDINSVIQKNLAPKLDELHAFWKEEFSMQAIQPASFYHCIEKPDGAHFIKMEQTVPQHITDFALKISQEQGITLFQYLVCMYQLLLYQCKSQDYIPVCTPIDMRIHAPELRKVITRCINVCPLVADFTGDQSVKDFIKANSQKIQNATENSAYPFELIQEVMPTDEVRNNINRHSLAMDNVSDLNSYKKHDQVKINIRNVWHTRTKYEFTTAFRYDKKTNKLLFDYGFNSKLCGLQFGALIPNRLMMLMERCATHQDMMISDKCLKITDEDLADSIVTVMTGIPGAPNNTSQTSRHVDKTSLANPLRRLSLSNGSNNGVVKSEEIYKDANIAEKKHSLLSYLRRMSRGSIDGDTSTTVNMLSPVMYETYRKVEDSPNIDIQNNLIHNKLNESISISKYNVSENNVNKPNKLNGSYRTNQCKSVDQLVDSSQFTDAQQADSEETGKPVNVLAKRRQSQPDIVDFDDMESEKEATGRDQDIFIMKTGYFLKQTTQGWDHRVHVTLQQETSSREYHDLYLLWGKSEKNKKGRLNLKTVKNIKMMKLNAHHALILQTPERLYVLKALDKTQTEDWLNTVKAALEETAMPIY